MSGCLTLKKSNCKNCYKCIRHCPVKSIRFSGNQAHIIADECILCGHCFVVCPQNAKQIADSTEKVKVLLQEDAPVIVSIAPSFIANYDGIGINSMREALKALGFFDVEETAIGATFVKNEYNRMLAEEKRDVVISSCCHSVNLLIQKYFPDLLSSLADVLSPMQAHAQDIKRRIPEARVVFIGPCVAKKDEAEQYPNLVDVVLTFEELTNWLKEEHIELKKECDDNPNSRARFFPTTGGILKTMDLNIADYSYIAIDGIENCIAALKDIQSGKIHHCFIEMSACAGSCIGGPVMEKYHRTPVQDYVRISAYAGNKDFDVSQPNMAAMKKPFTPLDNYARQPSEAEIKHLLAEMGKTSPEQELNCGSCGYNTCREKAVAIYQGKAEISMCLPFLKDRAESFSDTIVSNTPNGVIVLNEMLEVQQINAPALRMMNLNNPNEVLGEPIVRVLDPIPFLKVQKDNHSIYNESVYLAEYDRYVEQTVVPAKDTRMMICLMRDITSEENERQRKDEISRKTVEVADKVVDKQMRIVQEIASLLGETAAETKIALSKLKESISDE